ncbi:MAG: GGDEF domain-containing protein [Pseudomonadota bacterium]
MPSIENKTADIAASENSLRTRLNRLRFEPELEAEFRKDYEQNSLGSRLSLLLLSILAVALTPLYDLLFLNPPAGFVEPARLIQFGIEIPGLLLGLVCCLPPFRRWLTMAVIVGALTTSGGLMAQRVLGASFDYVVPFDFAAITVAAIYTLGRVRFDVFFPWAALIVVAASAAEIHTFGPGSESLYNCLSLLIMFALLSTGGYLLERTARENWFRRRQLSLLALHDPLTGLPNRRHFDNTVLQLVRAAARERGNVALMLIDIDDFKSYNDRYGHPAGDACLRRIGQWLDTQMRRPHDFCARIGGEEFVAIWSNAKPADARRLAEQLRAGISRLGIANESRGEGRVVTASGGFVEVIAPHPEEAAPSIAKLLIRRADDLLYRAKDAGRDRLICE